MLNLIRSVESIKYTSFGPFIEKKNLRGNKESKSVKSSIHESSRYICRSLCVNCVQIENCKKKSCNPVTHVIFDLNGTLINTEEINYKSSYDYVKRIFKKKLSMEIYGNIMATDPEKSAKIVINELNLPINANTYMHGIWQKRLKGLPKSKPMPGAERLVNFLRQSSVPMGLATGSDEKTFNLSTKCHMKLLENFCPIIIGGNEKFLRNKNKPHPAIYCLAARRFPNPPESLSQVLVIEDSLSGVIAARKAEMQVVMIPHPDLPKYFIDLAKPNLVAESLTDLNLGLFNLPSM